MNNLNDEMINKYIILMIMMTLSVGGVVIEIYILDDEY